MILFSTHHDNVFQARLKVELHIDVQVADIVTREVQLNNATSG